MNNKRGFRKGEFFGNRELARLAEENPDIEFWVNPQACWGDKSDGTAIPAEKRVFITFPGSKKPRIATITTALHEVGHIRTEEQYGVTENVFLGEKLAWAWAIEYARKHGYRCSQRIATQAFMTYIEVYLQSMKPVAWERAQRLTADELFMLALSDKAYSKRFWKIREKQQNIPCCWHDPWAGKNGKNGKANKAG